MPQYSRDIEQECECVDQVHEDIKKHPGMTARELSKGRNLVSVRASIELLVEEGRIEQRVTPGLDDLLDAERVFPVSSKLRLTKPGRLYAQYLTPPDPIIRWKVEPLEKDVFIIGFNLGRPGQKSRWRIAGRETDYDTAEEALAVVGQSTRK